MADTTIEWSEKTWNPVVGCEAISPGCAHCYAATMTRRLEAMGQADYAGLTTAKHFNGKVRCLPHKLDIPLKWRKPRRVFVNSMSDLFHEDVPDEFIDKVFAVMALCPQHTFQVLTKRAERMAFYCGDDPIRRGWLIGKAADEFPGGMPIANGYFGPTSEWRWPLPNVQLGISAEDQQRLQERMEWLNRTPATVRFLSCEPLLGPIRFCKCWMSDNTLPSGACRNCGLFPLESFVHWVIDGCESGPGKREYKVEWSRAIQDQCAAAGVPYFRKQMIVKGKVSHDPAEWDEDLRVRQQPQEAADAGR